MIPTANAVFSIEQDTKDISARIVPSDASPREARRVTRCSVAQCATCHTPLHQPGNPNAALVKQAHR
jgi:hypothetical protein